MKHKIVIDFCLFLLFSSLLSGCFSLFDAGSATQIKSFYNPPGNKQAILFLKGGNATETKSLQISIMDANNHLSNTEVGNTFTMDDNHSKAQLVASSIKIRWLNSKKLFIGIRPKFENIYHGANG